MKWFQIQKHHLKANCQLHYRMNDIIISKKFLNGDGSHCVEEMLSGMMRLYHGSLKKLDGYNVLVRHDIELVKDSRVSVISGGGSGHEPAMGGYCGMGMLSAAVCGGVFASPSVESILACIRTVTGKKGCLCIVMNYTGDRLNFGLAAEQAKVEGYMVEIVFVDDDCALSAGKGVTGRRGVAGTILVHKIAGAIAEQGASLGTVVKFASQIAKNVKTVGAALSVCNVPGKPLSTRLVPTDGEMELGLGIHGEAGRERLKVCSANDLIDKFLNLIITDFAAVPERVVLLLNNLGGTTPIEMFVLTNAVFEACKSRNIQIERIYCGHAMTSLEMQGVSLSVLNVSCDISPELVLSLLDAHAECSGWQNISSTMKGEMDPFSTISPTLPSVSVSSVSEKAMILDARDQVSIKTMIEHGAKAVLEKEAIITQYDKICGDGDCGETFAKGAQLTLDALKTATIETQTYESVFEGLGLVARKMGGSSGAVLAIFLAACQGEVTKTRIWNKVVRAGCDAVTRYGGATPGMRTLLDTLDTFCNALGSDFEKMKTDVLAGAENTKFMTSGAGRSNYIPEDTLKGTPDPGAMAVAFAIVAAIDAYQTIS